jgi:hypothetical protein
MTIPDSPDGLWALLMSAPSDKHPVLHIVKSTGPGHPNFSTLMAYRKLTTATNPYSQKVFGALYDLIPSGRPGGAVVDRVLEQEQVFCLAELTPHRGGEAWVFTSYAGHLLASYTEFLKLVTTP